MVFTHDKISARKSLVIALIMPLGVFAQNLEPATSQLTPTAEKVQLKLTTEIKPFEKKEATEPRETEPLRLKAAKKLEVGKA